MVILVDIMCELWYNKGIVRVGVFSRRHMDWRWLRTRTTIGHF